MQGAGPRPVQKPKAASQLTLEGQEGPSLKQACRQV